MPTVYLKSWAFGEEKYSYHTEEEARNGFFRLYVSSAAYCRDDRLARIIVDTTRRVVVDTRSVTKHPELTMTYRDWLYGLDEDQLTEERRRWESLHDYD